MRTNIDLILDSVHQAYAEAVALSGEDHTPQQFADFLKNVGSEVEVFLKEHIYGGSRNRDDFVKLINGLAACGLGSQFVTDLHSLRKGYNSAKHDPAYAPAIGDVLSLLKATDAVLREIQTLALGTTANPAPKMQTKRVLWIAAWDHFIGGDTEISISLPVSENATFSPELDLLYIDAMRWDEAKKELSAVGDFRLGKHLFPAQLYDSWANEGDFAGAGVFEGNYRDLINVLAKHERVEDILPFLKRDNHAYSMFAATAMACVDVALAVHPFPELNDLRDRIITKASHCYAAPRHSKLVHQHASKLAEMLLQLPDAIRPLLTGPIWVGDDRFRQFKNEALAQNAESAVLVSKDGVMVIKV